jgi:hypothetical protein
MRLLEEMGDLSEASNRPRVFNRSPEGLQLLWMEIEVII